MRARKMGTRMAGGLREKGRNREPNREKLLANIWTSRNCNITT